MAKELKNFSLVKVLSVKAYKLATAALIASMTELTDFNLDDSTPVEFLKGGETMAKLIPIVGSQEAKVTLTSALTNFDWLSLKMNDTVATGSMTFNSDVYKKVTSNTVSLTAAKIRSVFVVEDDANNRDGARLDAVTTASPASGQYKFATNTLTFNTDLEGKTVHIYYDEVVTDGKSVKSAGKQTEVVELVVDCVAIDADTQIPYIAQIRAPRCSITQAIKLSAKNEGTPDSETLEFDLLYDKVLQASYELKAKTR